MVAVTTVGDTVASHPPSAEQIRKRGVPGSEVEYFGTDNINGSMWGKMGRG